ncbi:MAG: glycosyltransferase family 4 protein [Rubricoccaceae bacterium]
MPDAAPPADAPLRVALFTGNYHHVEDGVTRTLGRVVGHLIEGGHAVLVFGPTVPAPPVSQPGTLVPVPSVSAPGRPEYRVSTAFSRAAQHRAEAFAPEIVHIATPDVLGHAALRWARRRGLPVVATYHTHFASYLDYYRLGFAEGALWRVLARFYNRCDEVYVPTPSMAEVLRARGIRSTMRLWPRGVETERFSPARRSEAWRAAQGFGPADVVVSFISRLVKEKGLDVYAAVLDRLGADGLPVRALVVGEGPERDALAARLPGARMTGHLTGDSLATAYASSDVFLFPSETETFGNVTLEAMASGVPPVVARATGSRSLVTDGETGLVCTPRDARAFAAATARLASDAALRQRMGAAARATARHYDWHDVLERLVGYYRAVRARHGRD